jgi:hypothetical protein
VSGSKRYLVGCTCGALTPSPIRCPIASSCFSIRRASLFGRRRLNACACPAHACPSTLATSVRMHARVLCCFAWCPPAGYVRLTCTLSQLKDKS